MKPPVLSVALLVVVAATARAQSAAEFLEAGIKAYENMQYGDAAGFLLRALGRESREPLSAPEHAEALAYLAAVEVLRGRADSAAAVFERLLMHDARYEPDDLIFPPEVTGLFAEVRRRTKVVHAELPLDTAFTAGSERVAIRLVASSFHDIEAELRRETGELVRTLYKGPIGDTLQLRWDGLDGGGAPLRDGLYRLAVMSKTPAGRLVRELQVPLEVRAQLDTLLHPVLPDSLFRPERWGKRPALEALLGGLLIAGGVSLLPSGVVGGDPSLGARFAVAGAIALGGVVGFVLQRPGRPIPENVQANAALRIEFDEQVAAVRRENARRRAAVQLVLHAGAPVLVHADRQ